MYRTLACFFFACAFASAADAQPQAPSPLWDGQESIADYAKRTNLPPTRTLDLGNGVNLELVLIPAGKFVMGTPEPKPVDEDGYHKRIVTGQAALAAGIGVLLVLIAVVIIRAVRQRHKPQYSLGRFVLMILTASVAVLGGMHWWYSTKGLAQARAEYKAALARFQTSGEWEKPAHYVTLTRPFHMGKYEVTQAQYAAVMGTNPSRFKGANLPVVCVSWDDATEFCKKVSAKAGLAVRLPTEAEWEFACRAGTNTTYNTGDTDADLYRAAWYGASCKSTTHPVGQKAANAFGLHDMHGNVFEWCADCFEKYKPGAAVDPQGPSEGQDHVLRGGSWSYPPEYCRSASRWLGSDSRFVDFGFRVVVEVPRTP
ncbi:MAG: formylglycine-generating enzyme family protein [Planctomycetota bacterium]|nr:formylglycine-generating enzyme family protein [Planctomycetota bacterium]